MKLTVSVPSELKARLDAMPEVNWPEVIKSGIINKIEQLERLERQS